MTEPTFRPTTLGDAELAADLMTAAYPSFAVDPVLTRYRWAHPRQGWTYARFITQMSGKPIAFVHWMHGPPEQDPHRHCEVGVALDRSSLEVELLTNLWHWATEQAAAGGSQMLEAYAVEDEPEVLEALGRVGYGRDRFEKVWKLDLGLHGARLVGEAEQERAEADRAGYELTTVARWDAPMKFEALYSLDTVTRKDIPTTFPILPETFENFIERLRSPDRPHDKWWVALGDGNPAAMSYLLFPPVRGQVWTGYTCCHPDHRGRGIARAVKLQSLAQAVALGVPYVYTLNDSENAPVLHINERLGYGPQPGLIALLKRVEK